MARERIQRRKRPATTPEMREAQLVDVAYDLVEERLRSGTASSQETTFFLKVGSSRERLEQLKMQHEVELMEVKKEQLTQQTKIEELYVGAIEAMRGYSGQGPPAEEAEEPPRLRRVK